MTTFPWCTLPLAWCQLKLWTISVWIMDRWMDKWMPLLLIITTPPLFKNSLFLYYWLNTTKRNYLLSKLCFVNLQLFRIWCCNTYIKAKQRQQKTRKVVECLNTLDWGIPQVNKTAGKSMIISYWFWKSWTSCSPG